LTEKKLKNRIKLYFKQLNIMFFFLRRAFLGGGILGFSLMLVSLPSVAFSADYDSPILSFITWLTFPLHLGVLIWLLKSTQETYTYGMQILLGVNASLIAGIIYGILFSGLTSLIFTEYYSNMVVRVKEIQDLRDYSPEVVETQLKAYEIIATPIFSFIRLAFSTTVSGLILSFVSGMYYYKGKLKKTSEENLIN